MARTGRKPHSDRPVYWKVSIRSSIAAELELRFTDPLTGDVRKGARSRLINQLLEEWLEKQRKSIDNFPAG